MVFLIKCFEIVLRPFLEQNSGQMTDRQIIHSAAQALLPKLTQATPLAGTGFGFPINRLKIGKDGAYQEYLEETFLHSSQPSC